jgi:RNA polymerase sigma factor (sigma-70 family)
MRQRQEITELFSTFLQFEAERVSGWATDARLRRNTEIYLKTTPQDKISETAIAIHWHQNWQQEQSAPGSKASTALGHLSAYLQESCYWSTYNVIRQMPGIRHSLPDCFQVAIAEVPKVLRAKDPQHPSSLKTYASYSFSNIIRDFLRQRRELDLCSDWGLLLKLSRKRLKEALAAAGMSESESEQRQLAWQCFETVYLPTKASGLRRLAPPDRQAWDAIANLYNRQRQQLSSPGENCSPKILERWLGQCVKYTRSYLYPSIDSLNRSQSAEDRSELQDSLVDSSQTNLINDWIDQEEIASRQAQYQQIRTVLTDAIATFDPTLQQLVILYYQKKYTQQQIAKELDIPQYTVSRKLTKAREKLLLAITQWSQETLHITPTSTVVKDIATLLDEWLTAMSAA